MNLFCNISLFILTSIPLAGICSHQNMTQDSAPAIVTGQLDNRFHYFVFHNDKPRREIRIQLVLEAGRKHEPEGKTGLAHLVTHLQFNSLPETNFRSMQMSSTNFWSDEYAQVNHEETVFTFTIKQADQTILAEYFQVLGLLVGNFDVSLDGFNVNKDLLINELPRLLKDMAISEYFETLQLGLNKPIPKDYESYLYGLAGLKVPDARSYFENNYDPERMTLLVTGDLSQVDDIVALISKHFGALESKLSVPYSTQKKPFVNNLKDSIHIVQMSGKHISLSGFDIVFRQTGEFHSNSFTYQDFLIQQMIIRCVRGRLKPLNLDPNNQILHTGIHYNEIIGNQPFLTLSTVARDNRMALFEVIQVLYDLLSTGMDSDELNLILKEMEADILKMTTEQLRPSTEQLSRNLLLSLTSPVPFRLPSQALEEFKVLLPKLDKNFMDQVLKESLNLNGIMIFVFEEEPLTKDQLTDEEVWNFIHFDK